MAKMSFEELDKLTENRYEAVLLAAQRARQVNAFRLAQLERLGENAEVIDGRKVTTLALQDLMTGKVKFRRRQQH
ncbi:putative DNA-directed RNA polymerase subunit omega [Candidatus Zixiibacteriota bacterium]|nr:putative DNA-directed RNA polymerase subunit omega [candidate division Zixibacteria bacterium]